MPLTRCTLNEITKSVSLIHLQLQDKKGELSRLGLWTARAKKWKTRIVNFYCRMCHFINFRFRIAFGENWIFTLIFTQSTQKWKLKMNEWTNRCVDSINQLAFGRSKLSILSALFVEWEGHHFFDLFAFLFVDFYSLFSVSSKVSKLNECWSRSCLFPFKQNVKQQF